MAYKKHIFWSLKKNGLFSYDSGGIGADRRLLHGMFFALGGPILDFWGGSRGMLIGFYQKKAKKS